MWLLALVLGCEPSIQLPSEVDNRILAGDYASACRGLVSSETEIRTYTIQRLLEHPDQPAVSACLCTALYDPATGVVNADIGAGVARSKRDDLATCLLPALDDPRAGDRVKTVEILAGIGAISAQATLADILTSSTDPSARAAAARGLAHAEAQLPVVVHAAYADTAPEVRAAAVEALGGQTSPDAVPALEEALSADHAEVRAAAVKSLSATGGAGDALVCKALLGDEEESVRIAAVTGWAAVARPEAIACLKKRLVTGEPSAAVRAGILADLHNSHAEDAKKALCDAIPSYTKQYVQDTLPEESLDIVKLQNDVDWDRSYDCVKKAIGMGGYTCYGRFYLAKWMNDLGGSAHASPCPGMAKGASAGGPHTVEMSF